VALARERAGAFGLTRVIPDGDDALFEAFRVRGAPGTLLLDPEGRVASPVKMGAEAAARRAGVARRGQVGGDRDGGCA
jgi:hypothetical protein